MSQVSQHGRAATLSASPRIPQNILFGIKTTETVGAEVTMIPKMRIQDLCPERWDAKTRRQRVIKKTAWTENIIYQFLLDRKLNFNEISYILF